MDVNVSHKVHKAISIIVYGGVFLFEVLFTGYAVYSANVVMEHPGKAVAPAVWIAISAYSTLGILVGLSWLVGFMKINKNRSIIRGAAVSA